MLPLAARLRFHHQIYSNFHFFPLHSATVGVAMPFSLSTLDVIADGRATQFQPALSPHETERCHATSAKRTCALCSDVRGKAIERRNSQVGPSFSPTISHPCALLYCSLFLLSCARDSFYFRFASSRFATHTRA